MTNLQIQIFMYYPVKIFAILKFCPLTANVSIIFQNVALWLPVHWGLCGAHWGGEKLSHHHADPVQRGPERGPAVQQPHAAPVAQGQEQRGNVSVILSFLCNLPCCQTRLLTVEYTSELDQRKQLTYFGKKYVQPLTYMRLCLNDQNCLLLSEILYIQHSYLKGVFLIAYSFLEKLTLQVKIFTSRLL